MSKEDYIKKLERENKILKRVGAAASGALWSCAGICPECGFKKDNHTSFCKKTFEELDGNPRDVEAVFNKAFLDK